MYSEYNNATLLGSAVPEIVVLDLPLNQSSGLVFAGDPPRVTQMQFDDMTHDGASSTGVPDVVGYYFSSLKLPGLEVSNIADCNHLRRLLLLNQQLPRQVVLVRQAPLVSTTAAVGCLYRHDLPAGMNAADLGLVLYGFPPKIKEIALEHSPLFGKLHPGQTVDALHLPGRPALTLQSGGFTVNRITTLLEETKNELGVRQLIVKDRPDVMVTDPRGDTRHPFDFGGLGNWFKPRRRVLKKP